MLTTGTLLTPRRAQASEAGSKVKELKTAKAPKEEIDAAVGELKELKATVR